MIQFPLGAKFRLTKSWTFTLFHEYRNEKLFISLHNLGLIYYAQGVKGYDSLTFHLLKRKGNYPNGRFWVKLADANNMEYEFFVGEQNAPLDEPEFEIVVPE